MQLRITLNFCSSCVYLRRGEITTVHHTVYVVLWPEPRASCVLEKRSPELHTQSLLEQFCYIA